MRTAAVATYLKRWRPVTGKRIWRFLFAAELSLLAVPLSVVCMVALGHALFDAASTPRWETIALALLVSCAALSIVSGWVLSLRWLRGGASALVNSRWFWWFFCSLGALLALAALASDSVMPSEQYTRMWHFRNDCSPFALGLVLLVPFTHLLIERFRHER